MDGKLFLHTSLLLIIWFVNKSVNNLNVLSELFGKLRYGGAVGESWPVNEFGKEKACFRVFPARLLCFQNPCGYVAAMSRDRTTVTTIV